MIILFIIDYIAIAQSFIKNPPAWQNILFKLCKATLGGFSWINRLLRVKRQSTIYTLRYELHFHYVLSMGAVFALYSA